VVVLDGDHWIRPVEALKDESVAMKGPMGVVPAWTVRNVAGGPVPTAFVAVRVNVRSCRAGTGSAVAVASVAGITCV
jgi:hypothetical protein